MRLGFVTIILAIFLSSASLVIGCECGETTQARVFAGATTVFEGVVTDIHDFDRREGGGPLRVPVTFEIARQWKGKAVPEIRVHAFERALFCDSFLFEKGQRYIVCASEQDKEGGWADIYSVGTRILMVGDCGRVREGKDIRREAALLGKPKISGAK